MKNNSDTLFAVFAVVLVITNLFNFSYSKESGIKAGIGYMQKELITRDLAQYCPLDWHWAYKGECDK